MRDFYINLSENKNIKSIYFNIDYNNGAMNDKEQFIKNGAEIHIFKSAYYHFELSQFQNNNFFFNIYIHVDNSDNFKIMFNNANKKEENNFNFIIFNCNGIFDFCEGLEDALKSGLVEFDENYKPKKDIIFNNILGNIFKGDNDFNYEFNNSKFNKLVLTN